MWGLGRWTGEVRNADFLRLNILGAPPAEHRHTAVNLSPGPHSQTLQLFPRA